jgi:hypothetical protein
VSPILMRPVREQLEHDRVIRLLQAKYRRRYQVGMNVGNEQTAVVGQANAPLFPDLVLWSNERGRRVEGVVEVETGESVNNMEALAEWAPFSRLRADFYLYVPNGSVDLARRLATDNNITVSEIWTYYLIGDQMRFTMVYKAPPAERPAPRRVAAAPAHAAARPRKPARRPAAKSARTARGAQRGSRAGASAKRASKKTARMTTRTQKRK